MEKGMEGGKEGGDVPVDDVCRLEEFEREKELVHKGLYVVIRELLRR